MRQSKKLKRLEAIREIIQKNKISNQDQLAQRLEKMGFIYTQATISRDLKTLKVSKISDNRGNYFYILPEEFQNTEKSQILKIDVQTIRSVAFSNNIVVIKTANGYANGIAASIDSLELFEVLGSVAGDDTIFIVLREGYTKNDFIAALVKKQPRLSSLF